LANRKLLRRDGEESRKRIRRRWIKKLENIRLSKDEMRHFKGYENISDEQAEQLGDFLAVYAIVIYNYLNNKE
jgi:hypothetical protein